MASFVADATPCHLHASRPLMHLPDAAYVAARMPV
jgi:hypothetical protein